MVGMHTFGSSAPLKDVMSEFGFTPDKAWEYNTGRLYLSAVPGAAAAPLAAPELARWRRRRSPAPSPPG